MLYRSRGSFSTKSTETVRYNIGHGGKLYRSRGSFSTKSTEKIRYNIGHLRGSTLL